MPGYLYYRPTINLAPWQDSFMGTIPQDVPVVAPPVSPEYPDFARGPMRAARPSYSALLAAPPLDAGLTPIPPKYRDAAPGPRWAAVQAYFIGASVPLDAAAPPVDPYIPSLLLPNLARGPQTPSQVYTPLLSDTPNDAGIVITFPVYRQDFEAGTTLGTACPELIDQDTAYTIDSTGTHALTGTHSLKLVSLGANHTIASRAADPVAGDITLSVYINNGSPNGTYTVLARSLPTGVSLTSRLQLSLGVTGITLTQVASGVATTLNTPISGVALPTGIWLCIELRCRNSTVSGRVVRQDNGQFFVNSGTGSWSATPQVQSGTTTLLEAAGSYGGRFGDAASLYVDDLIIETAVLQIDTPVFALNSGSSRPLTASGFTDPLRGVTWSTSNAAIAIVSSSGLVTATGIGTATITATGRRDTGQTATALVTVGATAVLTPILHVSRGPAYAAAAYLWATPAALDEVAPPIPDVLPNVARRPARAPATAYALLTPSVPLDAGLTPLTPLTPNITAAAPGRANRAAYSVMVPSPGDVGIVLISPAVVPTIPNRTRAIFKQVALAPMSSPPPLDTGIVDTAIPIPTLPNRAGGLRLPMANYAILTPLPLDAGLIAIAPVLADPARPPALRPASYGILVGTPPDPGLQPISAVLPLRADGPRWSVTNFTWIIGPPVSTADGFPAFPDPFGSVAVATPGPFQSADPFGSKLVPSVHIASADAQKAK